MRLIIKLKSNKTIVPFAHKPQMVGAIHKWIGSNNELHGGISLFCFSNIVGGKRMGDGLVFDNPCFYISSYDSGLLKRLIDGIRKDPSMCYGMDVTEVSLIDIPPIDNEVIFKCDSPILLKHRAEGYKNPQFLTYKDTYAIEVLKNNLAHKMDIAGLTMDKDIDIRLIHNEQAKVRLIDYRGVKNKCSECYVYVKADRQTLEFIWNAGLGMSTGIGFGAVSLI